MQGIVPLLAVVSLAFKAEPPLLRIEPSADDPTKVRVVATSGVKDLKIQLIDENGRNGPSIIGKLEENGDEVVFTPKYGLVRGLAYRASGKSGKGLARSIVYRVPKLEIGETAFVEQVYPTNTILPANNLKFYLQFSKPMREGVAIFDQIKILDLDNGRTPIPHPWRRVELWSHDATRLTLWIHPGRIKEGVNLREEEGPVLRRNRRYALEIPTEVLDARGIPLRKAYLKEFMTTTKDKAPPMPSDWKIIPPTKGSTNPLTVNFEESLDFSLLRKMLSVETSEGRKINGMVTLGNQERLWKFKPNQPWSGESYLLIVHPELEDLAGNTPTRIFDTDLRDKKIINPKLRLKFSPVEN